MTMRDLAKLAAFSAASILVLPQVLSFQVRAAMLGRDRALEGSTQFLALVPGLLGQYLRRAFLARALQEFHRSATIEFGTIFSRAAARIGENAYVGPNSHLGLVHVEADVLLGAGVHVPSGPRTHGTSDPSKPIREQVGEPRPVKIGRGAWIGSAAVVMADVGQNAVVGAGSVVTRPVPEGVVAGGVPARVLRHRGTPPSEAPEPL